MLTCYSREEESSVQESNSPSKPPSTIITVYVCMHVFTDRESTKCPKRLYWGEMGVLENGEMCVQSMGEMEKDFYPNFLQPFLESIDRRSCNDGSRELISVFHNPHRKCRPSPSSVACTLKYLEGVPS